MYRKNPGIYKIVCVPTGEVYVGQSSKMHKRINQHKRHLITGTSDNQHLQRAWVKYGAESFEFSVIESLDNSLGDNELRERLNELEQKWIDHYRLSGQALNIHDVIGNAVGWTVPEEARRKIGQANKGKRPWLGKHHTEETKRKLSVIKTGQVVSEATKQKLRESYRKPTFSADELERRRQRMLGNVMPAEIVERVRRLNSGTFVFTSPDGDVVLTDSIKTFCQDYGLDRSAMNGVHTGRRPHHKGWTGV